ncbi:MAG: murein L,D-transpeptidase family protein [Pseudobdellovibrionaceae bacterium]
MLKIVSKNLTKNFKFVFAVLFLSSNFAFAEYYVPSYIPLSSEINNEDQFDFPEENAYDFSEYDFELENVKARGSWCGSLAQLASQSKSKWTNPSGKPADYIVTDKSRRLTHILVQGKVVRTYKSALGKRAGQKRQEGDKKTPEGLYKIGYKNSNSDFHLSMQVSYPNAADREWARKNGVSPGSGIMYHGLPNNPFLKPIVGHPYRNWTAGCIAVNDREIEEMFSKIKVGTPIEICK